MSQEAQDTSGGRRFGAYVRAFLEGAVGGIIWDELRGNDPTTPTVGDGGLGDASIDAILPATIIGAYTGMESSAEGQRFSTGMAGVAGVFAGRLGNRGYSIPEFASDVVNWIADKSLEGITYVSTEGYQLLEQAWNYVF